MPSSLYGDSEEFIGKWFKRTGKRDEIFLATKFGFVMVQPGKFNNIDSSAKHAKEACAKSLKALGVDYIDLCAHPLITACYPMSQIG
jgi:aryl-alcohol dehydrogenase-like predicted oxidoreductase